MSDKPKTETWRPGLAWKDAKLYSFDTRSILVMRMWPEMRAWRRTRTRSWVPTRKWADRLLCSAPLAPGLIEEIHAYATDFVGPPTSLQRVDPFFRTSTAALAGLSSIPQRERSVAARFLDRRWHLLALMARCEWATELVEANPALAFALASNWILHKPAVAQPLRAARSLLKKPQLGIMDWLGFPATERVRRILMRISPEALTARRLPQLRTALHRLACQELLAHLPAISADVLRFMCCDETVRRVTPRFVHQLAAATRAQNEDQSECARLSDHFYRLWLDAAYMARDLGYDPPATLLSIQQLVRWHDQMSLECNRAYNTEEHLRARLSAAHFDEAPFHAASGIEPIRSGEELLEEGRAMNHCVASYCNNILKGNYLSIASLFLCEQLLALGAKVVSGLLTRLRVLITRRSPWRIAERFGIHFAGQAWQTKIALTVRGAESAWVR